MKSGTIDKGLIKVEKEYTGLDSGFYTLQTKVKTPIGGANVPYTNQKVWKDGEPIYDKEFLFKNKQKIRFFVKKGE